VANKFEFKTQEGTYLHGIAETFQGPNYANTIEYKDGKKVRAFCILLIILEMVLVLQIL
jgi:hypothetical protein